MSLENQIANLVGAANNLTSEVAGKMRQIDNKVDAATQSVPDVIHKLAVSTFTVNYENGVDDVDRPGNGPSPYKTILFAVQQALPGSRVVVHLRGEADHICEVPADLSHHNSFHNRLVEIIGDHEKEMSGNPSVIRVRCTPWSQDSNRARCNFFEGSLLKVAFNRLSLIAENKTGIPHYSGSFGGVFSRGTDTGGAGGFSDVSIFMSDVSIFMRDDVPLVTGYMGRLGIFAGSSRINGQAFTGQKLVFGNLSNHIKLSSTVLEGFGDSSVGDLFGFNEANSAQSIYS